MFLHPYMTELFQAGYLQGKEKGGPCGPPSYITQP